MFALNERRHGEKAVEDHVTGIESSKSASGDGELEAPIRPSQIRVKLVIKGIT